MPLPYIFASVATIVTSQFDANNAALGALTPIPCAVAGTNSLTLTPAANTPTVAAYANYMQFTGIVAVTSTGLITAQVGGLASLKVFADSSSGVAQASTGAMVANTAFTLMYDSTLDGGNGGFHLLSAVAVGAFLPLAGGTLTGAMTGTTVALSGPLTAASATVTGQLKGATVTGTSLMSAPTITSANLFSGVSLSLSGQASVASIAIGGGNIAKRMLWASVTLSYGALNPQTGSDQTVAMTGVKAGDTLMVGVPSAPTAGIVFFPYVSANDTVIVRAANFSASTLTPPAGAYQVTALGFA